MSAANPRGTTNSNQRGSSRNRLARRQYLVNTYRADLDVKIYTDEPPAWGTAPADSAESDSRDASQIVVPACRCYRCGKLLTVDTVTVDCIIPRCDGGTYRRNNIRPACLSCNSIEGNKLQRSRRKR